MDDTSKPEEVPTEVWDSVAVTAGSTGSVLTAGTGFERSNGAVVTTGLTSGGVDGREVWTGSKGNCCATVVEDVCVEVNTDGASAEDLCGGEAEALETRLAVVGNDRLDAIGGIMSGMWAIVVGSCTRVSSSYRQFTFTSGVG